MTSAKHGLSITKLADEDPCPLCDRVSLFRMRFGVHEPFCLACAVSAENVMMRELRKDSGGKK